MFSSLCRNRGRTFSHLLQLLVGLCLGAQALGCGSDDDANTADAGAATVDDFATVPKVTSAQVIEYKVEEQVVPAGHETVRCFYLPALDKDLYVSGLESYQGKFGHHLVLFQSVRKYPVGTVRNCDTAADMASMRPIISSVNFGLSEFPKGMAIRVPAGAQMIMQQHYVNTSSNDIRTRDALHITTMEKQDVTLLAGFYGLSNVDFNLPPGAQKTNVEFSCKAPRDMNLLLMGPHMHEWGVSIKTEVGMPGAMRNIIDIPTWQAQYRDMPPVTEWSVDKPYVLKEGETLHTTCVFSNTTEKALKFPGEMCATYGYYFPAPEGSEAWVCDGKE